MNPALINALAVVLAGGLAFFITMFTVLKTVDFDGIKPPPPAPLAAEDNPSWQFRNPEIDQWVSQIREERAALAVREEQLKDWEIRLAAENREISTVTQTVTKLQNDFDKRVLQFKDQEAANAKKQVKIVSDMSPEGAAAMFNQISDDEAGKLLFLMKPDVSGPILDAMSKLGPAQARRAATISQRLKDVLPMGSTNNLTSNANP
jgi:flagellar motility protein MotE (MotC chaperone)